MLVQGESKLVQDWDTDQQHKMHEKIRANDSKIMANSLLDEGASNRFCTFISGRPIAPKWN